MQTIHQALNTQSHCLQPDRLTLTPFATCMLSELHQIFTDPLVRRYLMDDQVVEVDWVTNTIKTSQQLFEQSGYGLWAVQENTRLPLIGFCGYWYFNKLSYPLQLIYGLLPAYWGKGLAAEAARAIIEYGFEQARFLEIVAAADIPNIASFNVMKRLGMRYWKREEAIEYFKIQRQFISAC